MKNFKWVVAGLLMLLLAVQAADVPADSFSSIQVELAAPVESEPILLRATDMAELKLLSDAQLDAFVKELATQPTITFEAQPKRGAIATCFSLQHPEWPPLPGNVIHADVWQMTDFWLLDDLDHDYNPPKQVSRQMSMMSVSGPPGFGDGGGDTNPITYYGLLSASDYGTNLWIAQTRITNGYLAGIGTNTLADVQYEIQSRTNLLQNDWLSEGFILGSEVTNWTPLSVAQGNRTNLFVRLKSWASSDGSGLPDWWQIQYFGTNGVDPYGNPAGDGWSNLQKYQKCWSPNTFYTPPAFGSVRAVFNPTNRLLRVTWQPSVGGVTSYLVQRHDNLTGQTTGFSIDAALNEFLDDLTGSVTQLDNFTYSVTAQYAGGASDAGSISTTADNYEDFNSDINLILGPEGSLYFIFRNAPTDFSALRVNLYDGYFYFSTTANDYLRSDLVPNGFSPITDGSFEISATNFVNGICKLPDSQTWPFYTYDIQVQTVRSNGVIGNWIHPPSENYYSARMPKIDLRIQMKDNLRFLLRSATKTRPLEFQISSYYQAGFSWSSNYVASGFQNSGAYSTLAFDALRPVYDNIFFQNFIFDSSNLKTNGFLNTGGYPNTGSGPNLFFTNNSKYYFDLTSFFLSTNYSAPSSVLPTNQTQWLLPPDALVGTFINGTFSNSIRNRYGLAYVSQKNAVVTNGQLAILTIYPGQRYPAGLSGVYYPEIAQPIFQLTNYYFARPYFDPVPETNKFSVTNQTKLMLQSVGSRGWYAGYAKLAILNGFTNKFGYLGQYFDAAYKINTNGTSTIPSGVLSPYGNFFATEPGAVALVTMPDIDTGTRGTCTVNCVSIQLDSNHDGVMDLATTGTDANSSDKPMDIWINNGTTISGTNGSLDHDVQALARVSPNYAAGKVICQRDLENFFRLWICGVPNLPASQGYSVTLSGGYIESAINLYTAETNGGILYLTDTNTAQSLVGRTKLGTISAGSFYTFPTNFFDGSNKYFLFEGTNTGYAELVLRISKGTNILTETYAYLDLHDVKELYEQAHITKVIQTWPEMVQQTNVSGFQIDRVATASSSESKEMAVFVHGWRMTQFDYEKFSDTMFKQLYWQGFQGRFAALRWPTRSADTDTNGMDILTYNRSERIAFNSGTGAAAYFNNLRQRFPNYTISTAAHSQGNILMMQALKELTASNQAPLDNYVMMQAAVPAHCYDTSAPNFYSLTDEETLIPTPNTYANYAAGITNALRFGGKIINFFNTNDYALASATTNKVIFGVSFDINVSWTANQGLLKPLVLFGYSYDLNSLTAHLTNAPFGVSGRIVNDVRELMPFVARPRCRAVGAQEGVGQIINGGELNLSPLGFGDKNFDHSGQFNRNIQDPAMSSFYFQLRAKLFPQ